MLQPILHVLNSQRIVLASGSPRRKQILENIGLKFEVIPSSFVENLDKSTFSHPSEYVKETARLKTLEVVNRLKDDQTIPHLIIGADTVVAMENEIYEKPRDREDAIKMLSRFSGKSHTVYTGMVLVSPVSSKNVTSGSISDNFHFNIFHEATDVMMAELSEDIINKYIDTGEPMDKAGGYGIQAIGGTLITGIHGDYYNVMGFPLHSFSKLVYNLYTQSS